MATFIVSGAPDIGTAAAALKRAGFRVRHDGDVADSASAALRRGSRSIVVAHGDENGTVHFFKTSNGRSIRWLWVGMTNPPAGCRVYLYSCLAGKKLAKHLKRCDCFGHVDVVPMPQSVADDPITEYLRVAQTIVDRKSPFNRAAWRAELLAYVTERYLAAIENHGEPLHVYLFLLLMRSLGGKND